MTSDRTPRVAPARPADRDRFLVTNSVALNGGDAAILMGLLEGMRVAFGTDARVEVADDAWAAAQRAYPEVSFVPPLHGAVSTEEGPLSGMARSLRRRRVTLAGPLLGPATGLARLLLPASGRRQLDRLQTARAVISTGGTYLVEHYPLRYRLETIATPVRLGIPTYLYTQSLGPFSDRATARRVAAALDGVRGVFLRDERSRDHLLALGVEPPLVGVHADAAFALAHEPAAPPPAEPLRVAVSVRHWPHHRLLDKEEGQRRYRRAVGAVVRELADRGAQVTFLSTCQGQAEYRTDDSQYARRIVAEELRDAPGVRVDASFRTPEQLIEELAGYHLAIATRMHFAILALCAGVPVAPIAYEFKTTELFAGLGWGDRVTELETINAEELLANVEATLADADAIRSRLREEIPELRADAVEPARRIRDDLEGPGADRAFVGAPVAGAPRSGRSAGRDSA